MVLNLLMSDKLGFKLLPRFCELDGLGHINNAIFLQWFEQARTPIFEMFNPSLDLAAWNLIIARTEVDYLKPVGLKSEVLILTYLSKIGNSSMIIEHELYQDGKKAAHGKAAMIHFDYANKKSVSIPDDIKQKLLPYLNIY